MAGYFFWFGDTASDEIGLIVNGTPDIGTAQRDGQFVSIPGKDGDDYIDNGKYKNVEFSLEVVAVQKGSTTVREIIDTAINEYAYLQGYQYFEDSPHDGYFTEAALTNFGEFRKEMIRLGRATLKFTRKPFWYETNQEAVDIPLTGEVPSKTFNNPSKIFSKPIIEMTLSSSSPFTIEYSITDQDGTEHTYSFVTNYGTGKIVIDCEKKTVKQSTTPIDCDIPKGFEPGASVFKLLAGKSSISSIQIYPRWRFL